MTNLFLTRTMALLLAAGLLGSATQAKAPASHSKKAAHKPVSKKPVSKKAASGGSGASSQWTPDPKLLSHLQPEQQFGVYSMRLPVGYTVEEHDMSSATGHLTGYLIKGPDRPDGTAPVIMVFAGSASPGSAVSSADALLDGNKVINGKPDLTKSDKQDGENSGLSLVRQYFKYRFGLDSSHWIHGFHYATTDGQTDALVAAIDAAPYNAVSLPLAEAAALTLHKTP